MTSNNELSLEVIVSLTAVLQCYIYLSDKSFKDIFINVDSGSTTTEIATDVTTQATDATTQVSDTTTQATDTTT